MVTTTALSQDCWQASGKRIGFGANRPMSPVEKVADRLNAKPFSLGNVLHFLAIRTAADKVSGHFARHLGQPVTVFSADTLTALRGFVGHVFGLRSKPKVSRVDAGWCVASVQNTHSGGNSALVNGVGISVGQALYGSANTKKPVTVRVSGTIPNPTITALVNVTKKTNGWVFGFSRHEATLAFSEVV